MDKADSSTIDFGTPTLEDFQHWTQTIGRAQQLLMEFAFSPEGGAQAQAMLAKLADPAAGVWPPVPTDSLPPPRSPPRR
jgi:hypothetical protein